MTNNNKKVLNELSKEQLIYLIDQLYHSQFLIGEVLVDESKWHIDSDDAINKIRVYMYNMPNMNNATELKAYIDMKLGKITVEEYRNIMGFETENIKPDMVCRCDICYYHTLYAVPQHCNWYRDNVTFGDKSSNDCPYYKSIENN